MNKNSLQPFIRLWPTAWPGLLIFCLAGTIFAYSSVHQLTDSNYSMMASQSLLERGTFALEHYALPRHEPFDRGYYISNGPIYQIELANGHMLYHLPPGSSVLSVPYVGLMKFLGISTTNADGSYNVRGEAKIEYSLAIVLMSVLAVIFFYTARLALPVAWSLLLAFGGALGTQVWSTASRAMWSDTWGITLLGIVVWMLLAQEVKGRRISPVLLASLLAWLYFIRPTNAVHILAVTVYVFIFYRRLFIKYAITGAVWFLCFIAFSWHYHGRLLPSYYQARRLNFDSFWVALAGNLVSPGRGLLVYVPVIFFIIYLLVRYRNHLISQRLVVLSLAVIVGHLAAISGFPHWWGGHSFGARFSTGIVPWFVLLAILGLKAMLTWRERERSAASGVAWKGQLIAGSALLLLSVFINARGAMSHATWRWNTQPRELDQYPERLWDWREPQFLAGWVPHPPQRAFPLNWNRIDFATADADKVLWYGWSEHEERFRWTNGKEAAIVFSLDELADLTLQTMFGPFLAPGKRDEQRVTLLLNGQPLETLTLTEDTAKVYQFILPKSALRESNVLTFALPDAASPLSLGINPDDPRALGIAVYWMQFQPKTDSGAK